MKKLKYNLFNILKIKKMATPRGFEPQLIGPKPIVLPLHHGVALSTNIARFDNEG